MMWPEPAVPGVLPLVRGNLRDPVVDIRCLILFAYGTVILYVNKRDCNELDNKGSTRDYPALLRMCVDLANGLNSANGCGCRGAR